MRKDVIYEEFDPSRVEHFLPQSFADGRVYVSRLSKHDFSLGELRVDDTKPVQLLGADFDVIWALANHVDIALDKPLSKASLIRAAADGRPYTPPYRQRSLPDIIRAVRRSIANADQELGHSIWGAVRRANCLGYYATSSLIAERPARLLVARM